MKLELPSEQQMFKVVVLVGIAAVPVVALALLVSPLAGALLICFEIGIGLGVLRRFRLAARTAGPQSAGGDWTQRLVVLAGETIASVEVGDEVARFSERHRRCEVRLVMPVAPGAPTEPAAGMLAVALRSIGTAGIKVSGEVTSDDPYPALSAALSDFPADEIVIATFPAERSSWLDEGVVARAGLKIEIPIHHVVVRGDEA